MKKRTKRSCLIFILAIFLFYGIPSTIIASDVNLIPMSIRHGLESVITTKWPLEDASQVYNSKNFKLQHDKARKAGGDLYNALGYTSYSSYNPKNKNFYLIFYNLAESPSCGRNYLVQRIKMNQTFYNKKGKKIKETDQYLVEVMKTKNGRMKKGDEHYRRYSLKKAYKRKVNVEAEIGCGQIPGVTEGQLWPYDKGHLYFRVQDYSISPGYYYAVNFEFSAKYSYSFEFSADGRSSVKWPSFIR